jgi:hypothetical protein
MSPPSLAFATECFAGCVACHSEGGLSSKLGRALIQSECGKIVSGQTVVSCCQASPVLGAAEETLDEVATSIDGAIEQVGNSPRCCGWLTALMRRISSQLRKASAS